jgi:hypothetical protein
VTFFLVIMIHLHLNELTNKTNIVEIVSLKKNVFLVKLISVGCKKKTGNKLFTNRVREDIFRT